MIKELNLRTLRKALNAGETFQIYYTEANFPIRHNCYLPNLQNTKTVGLYGEIANVVTPDKKELLNMLKISVNYAIQLELCGDYIKSSLILHEFTDPMDLMKDYYDLPFLSVYHPRLKTCIHKLNDAIRELGISEELDIIQKSFCPQRKSEEYFCFELEEDTKSLRLVRRKQAFPKINIPSLDDELPF